MIKHSLGEGGAGFEVLVGVIRLLGSTATTTSGGVILSGLSMSLSLSLYLVLTSLDPNVTFVVVIFVCCCGWLETGRVVVVVVLAMVDVDVGVGVVVCVVELVEVGLDNVWVVVGMDGMDVLIVHVVLAVVFVCPVE